MGGVCGLFPGRSLGAFREKFCEQLGVQRALFTDSGTSALTIAFRGALRRQGGLIALPAYGCYDLATAADGAGARVVLYDLDPNTLQPEPESLQAVAGHDLAAVVVVHLFGIPVDVPRMAEVLHASGALIIEDAAQGAGAQVRGRPAGTLGSLGVFSFGRGKGITGGSGGALVANDSTGSSVLGAVETDLGVGNAGMRELVTLAGQWLLGRPNLYGIPAALPFLGLGETIYKRPRPPRTMSRVAFRVLNRTWDLAEAAAAGRRRTSAALWDAVKRYDGDLRTCETGPWGSPGLLRMPLLASPRVRRSADAEEARSLGIMPGYPQALCDLRGFRHRCSNADGGFRGARELAARLITFPTHNLLSSSDVVRIALWVRAVAG